MDRRGFLACFGLSPLIAIGAAKGSAPTQLEDLVVRVSMDTGDFRAEVQRISAAAAQQVTANGLRAYDKGKRRQQMTGRLS